MPFSSIVADSIEELRVRPERRDIGPHKPTPNPFGLCTACGKPVHEVIAEWYDDTYYANSGTPKRWYWRHNPIKVA